jgi:uncharacterized membrane protein
MRSAVVSRWREAINGFWLIPGGVAVLIAALAFVLVGVDRSIDSDGSLGFDGDASAARDLLGVIAASLITVAGLAFSITMVTLQLVASQFSPRALRGLLGDRPNQVVVGLFLGVFAYCVLVMRTVSDAGSGREEFVPGVAVTTSIGLAFVALAALVYFIHHVGQAVQVSEIAADIGRRALAGVEAAAGTGEDVEDPLDAWRLAGAPATSRALRAGFVQSIDTAALAHGVACDSDVRVHVTVRPGDFVTEADVVLEAWPRAAVEGTLEAASQAAIIVEDERDDAQDPGYPVRLLADIALRALSPGVNDPTTAVTAIGYLRAALERAAALPDPPRVSTLDDDRATIVHSRRGFEGLLDDGVAELSRSVGTYAYDPLLHLLDTVEREARRGPRPERADAVQAYRDEIARVRAAAA